MSQQVPKVNQAFVLPIFLYTTADVLITDPSSVYTAGDVTAFFGTSGTEVTLSAARRGSTPVLDVSVSAGQHTAAPVIIQVRDRDGTAFKTREFQLFTNPDYKYSSDDNYAYIKSADGSTVLRHAPILKDSGETFLGPWVEGEP